MAKAAEKELGDDFSYIIRMADTDVDGLKKPQTALTSVRGIGNRTAAMICDASALDRDRLAGHMTSEDQELLRSAIEEYSQTAPTWMLNRQRDPESGEYFHIFGQDAKLTQEDDISRLRAIKAYRGVRHATGNKVRGQRGRSNGRSGLTLGVQKKK